VYAGFDQTLFLVVDPRFNQVVAKLSLAYIGIVCTSNLVTPSSSMFYSNLIRWLLRPFALGASMYKVADPEIDTHCSTHDDACCVLAAASCSILELE
jgi:hypothetical protein